MGQVFELAAGRWTASITQVGATLRALTLEGDDVVTTFPANGRPEHSQGATLAPWPNRLRGGGYEWEGERQQFPIEPGKAWTIHGLVKDASFEVVEVASDRVVLSTTVDPQPGWPGELRLDVAYLLTADGLVVEVSAINLGIESLPFGYGAHPYLVLGDRDAARLEIPAEQYLVVDADMLPERLEAVARTEYDYREARGLGSLDTAFTTLATDDEGSWTVSLADGGRTIEVWGDASFGWVQVYTPGDGGSVAVEPMTCGPDAFNAGAAFGLVVLEPGEGIAATWGIRA